MRREEIEVRTADGRRLRAELSGPEEGSLVVLQPGTPGPFVFDGHVEEGAERGFRHLCCFRPGYRGSDRRPGWSFADCAADTIALVDALGVEEFHVVGQSSGGGPALACAALHPQRVISVAVLASFAPRSARGAEWLAGTGRWNVEEFEALQAGEEALLRFIAESLEGLRGIRDGSGFLEALGDSLSDCELAALEGRFLEFQAVCCGRIAASPVWGWFDDDQAIWGEWGFDPTGIDVPVSVWHGEEDRLVPVAEGEWLARNLPTAQPHLMPAEGHFSLAARHYGPMLDELSEGNVCSPA